MYIYSIFAVIAIAMTAPHIRKRTPLPVISFAYFYVIDSIVNAMYTLLFAVSWFLVISEHRSQLGTTFAGEEGDKFINNNNPEYEKITPATLSNGVLQPESATSIIIICLLWAVRVYFCLVVVAYARRVVRDSATPGAAPFTGKNGGDGWQGKAGRVLVGFNRGYWEGAMGWQNGGAKKFRRSEEPLMGRPARLPREIE